MTIRLSTGARNGLAEGLGFGGMFNKGYIKIWSGSQPANPDTAESGTNLGKITVASGAHTKETRATGTIVITGAAGGSINTVTVGTFNIIPDGPVAAVTGDTAATAAALNVAINRNGIYTSSVSGSTVTIKPRPGVGDAHNGLALTASLTTVTATYGGGTVSGGVDPVNGLTLLAPASGVISKSAEVWSMLGLVTGTAGWFRLYGSDDPEGATSSILYPRMDGSCGVGSGDAQLSSLAVTLNSPHTVDVFTLTIPSA